MSIFGGKDPRDALVEALQAEIARANDREKQLQAQIADLVNKLSAHADTRAHLAATRPPSAPPHNRAPAEMRLPPGITSLAGGRHVDLHRIRARDKQRAKGIDTSNLPPLAD